MPDGDTIQRTAAALRTALVDKKMLRFDAPRLIGITPRAGRTIVRVGCRGKHLEIEWDDEIILHTHLRLGGTWHLYRAGEAWLQLHHHVRAVIEVPGWVAVCFDAPVVETYRRPDVNRHPGIGGGLGPDLSRDDADLGRCIDLLLSYRDPKASVAEVLLDQRVFCGVGNVYRCEVLWAGELCPFAHVGTLPETDAVRMVNLAARLVRDNLRHAARVTMHGVRGGLAVYGRGAQPCQRCATSIESRRASEHSRVLYWCPGCQTRLDPRDPTVPLPAPMDPHPAATRFLEDLPWRRPA